MKYRVDEKPGASVLHLIGEIVVTDRGEFEEVVDEVLAPRPQRVTVDMSEVEFMDSAGLGLLLMLREEALAKQAKIVLEGAQGHVRDLFEAAGFELLFDIAG